MALNKLEKDLLKASVFQSIEGLQQQREQIDVRFRGGMDKAIQARKDLIVKLINENII